MNQLAFKHYERLTFAARRLTKDIMTMRNEGGLSLTAMYPELYAARRLRLTYVTQARRALGCWMREHPKATKKQVEKALAKFEIPQNREDLTEAIRRIEREAITEYREHAKFKQSWKVLRIQDPKLGTPHTPPA